MSADGDKRVTAQAIPDGALDLIAKWMALGRDSTARGATLRRCAAELKRELGTTNACIEAASARLDALHAAKEAAP